MELERLYRGAVRKRWLFDGPRDRLWFWAAAEHALMTARNGTEGNLFAWLVSGNHRGMPSEEAERRAEARLKKSPPAARARRRQ